MVCAGTGICPEASGHAGVPIPVGDPQTQVIVCTRLSVSLQLISEPHSSWYPLQLGGATERHSCRYLIRLSSLATSHQLSVQSTVPSASVLTME